jgi:hypothetical protein
MNEKVALMLCIAILVGTVFVLVATANETELFAESICTNAGFSNAELDGNKMVSCTNGKDGIILKCHYNSIPFFSSALRTPCYQTHTLIAR